MCEVSVAEEASGRGCQRSSEAEEDRGPATESEEKVAFGQSVTGISAGKEKPSSRLSRSGLPTIEQEFLKAAAIGLLSWWRRVVCN